MGLHVPRELVLVEREPALAAELARQFRGEAVGRRQLERVLPGDRTLGRDLLENAQAAGERLREALLLAANHLLDARAMLDELRVPGSHLLRHDVGQPPHLAEADRMRLLDGAPDDPPQDVAAAFVGGGDAVADEERHAAPVVGEDPVRLGRAFVGVPGHADLLLDPGHDRLEAVRLVHRADVLDDGRGALEPQARIDVLLRQRRQRAVGVQLVLHEDEVPELEEAVAARARRGACRVAAAVLLAPVPVDLRVRAARPRSADRPEVLRARQADDALTRHPDPLPELDRGLVLTQAELRIAGVHRHPDPRPVQPEPVLHERGRVLDRAVLEVLAEREVAEHLVEGEVVAVEADLVDVGRAEALLRGRGQQRRRLLAAEEEGHLRLHAGRRQQRRVVVRTRHERP